MYLTQGLQRAVQQNPGGIATIFGDRVRSFAEQADRVARLAGALRRLGIEPGDRVAYLGLNSDRYIEYLLAVPWADAVLSPVNIRWSPAERTKSSARWRRHLRPRARIWVIGARHAFWRLPCSPFKH